VINPEARIYINGKFYAPADAKISVFNWSFIYGDGVFEGLPMHKGRCFRLMQHLDRLYTSITHMQIPFTLKREEIVEIVRQTVKENKLSDGYMRFLVARGTGPTGLRNIDMLQGPDIVVIPQLETQRTTEESAQMKVRAKTVGVRRTPPECLDPRVKANNYQNMILAKLEQRAAGADQAIMLDIHGFIAEGPAENIFAVRQGKLLTPLPHNVLNGVTRGAIMEIGTDQGLNVREMNMTLHDLYNADELFVSGSLHGIAPITEIDGRKVGEGKMGPISRKILEQYWAMEAQEGYRLM